MKNNASFFGGLNMQMHQNVGKPEYLKVVCPNCINLTNNSELQFLPDHAGCFWINPLNVLEVWVWRAIFLKIFPKFSYLCLGLGGNWNVRPWNFYESLAEGFLQGPCGGGCWVTQYVSCVPKNNIYIKCTINIIYTIYVIYITAKVFVGGAGWLSMYRVSIKPSPASQHPWEEWDGFWILFFLMKNRKH